MLDGLILGDNVVLLTEAPALARHLEDALITESLARGQRCFYVSARSDLPKLAGRLPSAVTPGFLIAGATYNLLRITALDVRTT